MYTQTPAEIGLHYKISCLVIRHSALCCDFHQMQVFLNFANKQEESHHS